MAKFRTEYSMFDGNLEDRMTEYLSHLIGLAQSELGGDSYIGRKTLRWRVEMGVYFEFGSKARVTFPDLSSVVLKCGRTITILSPGY